MGGRGTFASGKSTNFTYETVGEIHGVKVLKGIGTKHSLPEESHGSSAYIKLKHDGTFHELRLYDKDKFLTTEIAYHREPNISKKQDSVLHYHIYDKNFNRTKAIELLPTDELYKKYKKFFKGIF